MFVRCRVLIVVALFFAPSMSAAQPPDGTALEGDTALSSKNDTAARQLMAIIDAVVEHHINPPTRQQLVLETLRRLNARVKRPATPGLANRISRAHPEALEMLLAEELGRMHEGPGGKLEINAIAMPQLLDGVVDGFSVITAEQSRIDRQLAANLYVGIGIQLSSPMVNGKRSRGGVMQRVFPGGPADKAGAKDGDFFVEVDGKPVGRLSIAALVERLRGPRGSTVEIVVKQPDEETPRTYKLTRDVVPIASVSPVGYADAHGVACIQINQVKSSTVHELREIEASLDSATEVVALDFRALGDFDLHNGKLLANALIDGGLVGTAESVSGSEKFTAEPGRLFTGRELVVLIGPDTIGTPEWIAAALQDLQQAKLLGAPTSGHGQFIETVETSVPDLLVTIPIGRLRRANGVSLQLTTDERKSLTKIEMPKSTFFDFKSITAD